MLGMGTQGNDINGHGVKYLESQQEITWVVAVVTTEDDQFPLLRVPLWTCALQWAGDGGAVGGYRAHERRLLQLGCAVSVKYTAQLEDAAQK